jgi:N6-adenosine-specific RNA methylase IME4
MEIYQENNDIFKIPELKKKYKIIYADPPWNYNDKLNIEGRGVEYHYSTMKDNDIKKLPIYKLADDDCILFMWITMPKLQTGLDVIHSWGFKYKTCGFCWIKTNPKANTVFKGLGHWVMGNAELCLLAVKGRPQRINKNVSQVIMAHRGKHSVKPNEAREKIIQLMGDVPRIELFARQKIEGWDTVDGNDNADGTGMDIINWINHNYGEDNA